MNIQHRIPASARNAFTLIELLVAIGLGSMVVLLAVAGFRAASRAIQFVSRLSAENEQLRAGVLVALDDADFWNSTASPDLPWARRFNSIGDTDLRGHALKPDGGRVVASDPAALRDAARLAACNRRPFRPVTFRPYGSAIDPASEAWSLDGGPVASDAWYRNHVTGSTRPIAMCATWYGDGYQKGNDAGNANPRAWHNNFLILASKLCGGYNSDAVTTGNLYDWASPPRDDASGWHWDPRLLEGDYTLVSCIADGVGGAPAGAARPDRSIALYRQLGMVGVSSYVPAGDLTVIQGPDRFANGGTPVFANRDDTWRLGEIPWAWQGGPDSTGGPPSVLSPGTQLFKNSSNAWQWTTAEGVGVRPSGTDRPWAAQENYAGALTLVSPPNFAWSGAGFDMRLSSRSDEALFATDFLRRERQAVMLFSGTLGNVDNLFDRTAANLVAQAPYWLKLAEGGTGSERGRDAINDYRQMLAAETQLVPFAATGDATVDPGARPASLPSLRLQTFRYRDLGAELCMASVVVSNPTTGGELRLPFSVLGTTYRGARQHWGQIRSVRDAGLVITTPADIGDHHAP